jgi:GNAT superfamily N-acetyltransferase
MIAIRAAAEADVPLLLALIGELASYEKLAHQVVADEHGLRTALFGPRPAAEAVVAEIDGAPAGFALFFQSFSTFLGRAGIYLEDLFVRPEVRRRGVGRALLVHLARLAVERRCGRFEWAVLDWNQPALAFYQRMGAVPLSDWTVHRLTGEALTRAAAGTTADPTAGTAETADPTAGTADR